MAPCGKTLYLLCFWKNFVCRMLKRGVSVPCLMFHFPTIKWTMQGEIDTHLKATMNYSDVWSHRAMFIKNQLS
ncbi:hypothetical protein Leryth_014660, partial [Lithospermum erythrorhizon]